MPPMGRWWGDRFKERHSWPNAPFNHDLSQGTRKSGYMMVCWPTYPTHSFSLRSSSLLAPSCLVCPHTEPWSPAPPPPSEQKGKRWR